MLILNADDFGRNEQATNNILRCYQKGSVTSASAMVYMEDAERAASMARATGLRTGLHLNFTEGMTSGCVPNALRERQQQVAQFLRGGRYRQVIYNPLLGRAFDYVYKAQWEEYMKLYSARPTHIDGHHHMHLCANVLIGGLIDKGARVRRPFSSQGRAINAARIYRRIVAAILERYYRTTDAFYSIAPVSDVNRLAGILNLSKTRHVELALHPERPEELQLLTSYEFRQLVSDVDLASYVDI